MLYKTIKEKTDISKLNFFPFLFVYIYGSAIEY